MNHLLEAMKSGVPAEELRGHSPLAVQGHMPPIQKLSYNHEALIDQIITNPWISQNELADLFGLSASWISTVMSSDLFQARLAERRDQLVDPELRTSVKAQFEGLLSRSMEVLRHKLSKHPDDIPDQLALQTAKVMSQSLGHGGGTKPVSKDEVKEQLETLGNNLVGLLRRKRVQADTFEGEFTDVQAESGPSGLQSGGASSQ